MIEWCRGEVVEGQDGAHQEEDGEEETVESRCDIVPSQGEQGDVDQSHEDPTNALSTEYWKILLLKAVSEETIL